MRLKMKVGLGLLVLLCVTALTTTSFKATSSADLQQETDILLPVTIKQLKAEDSVIAVELSCEAASVTTPNRLNGFVCNLKNNTSKNITGACVGYAIVFRQGDKEFRDTRFHTLVTSIDPDFDETTKSIVPGGVSTVRPAGVLTYENSNIRGVEVYVDYIEFEDGTSLGVNENGARFINDFRDGASKYKSWLAGKYKKGGSNSIIELLANNQPLPELEFKNPHQEYGAKFYRRRLLKMYKTRGLTDVQKHLAK